jgi:hypothetical protein
VPKCYLGARARAGVILFFHRSSTPTHDTHARRQRRVDHGWNARRRHKNLLALRSCSLRRGHLLLLLLPTLLVRAPKDRAACLPSLRAQATPAAGQPSHPAPAQRTRATAPPPSRTNAQASRDTSLTLLSLPKTLTRSAQVSTTDPYQANPKRRAFAYLLKPLLICSSCVLLSTFHYTIYFILHTQNGTQHFPAA